jgi:hypothetical protein
MRDEFLRRPKWPPYNLGVNCFYLPKFKARSAGKETVMERDALFCLSS